MHLTSKLLSMVKLTKGLPVLLLVYVVTLMTPPLYIAKKTQGEKTIILCQKRQKRLEHARQADAHLLEDNAARLTLFTSLDPDKPH